VFYYNVAIFVMSDVKIWRMI